jgi:hypothetical protein
MDGHTEHNENKKRSAQPRPGRPRKHRALALLLALVMLLASSGIQAAGQTEAETSEEVSSETTEEEVSLTQDEVTYETEDPQPAEEAAQETEAAQPAEPPADTEEPQITTQETQVGGYTLAADGDYDITSLMTKDSYILVQLEENGEFYTLAQLNAQGLKVPKGATVQVHLEWDKITGIQKGQKLVYQIPAGVVSDIVAEPRFMFTDAKKNFAGYMSLTEDGLFTVEIDEKYYDTWVKKQNTGSLELDYLTLEFYASLSKSHGETSGNNDEVISFKDKTSATVPDEVKFTIPFEYKNEHSRLSLTKESKFNPVTQSVDYTITVTSADTNTMTAENVKITDVFEDTTYLVAASGSATGVYQDIKAVKYASAADAESETNGTEIKGFKLNYTKGILTIGNMEPGSVVVLTYSAGVSDKYFSNTTYPEITNTAQASYNDTTSNAMTTKQKCDGSAKIKKSVGSIVTDSDGNTYLEYKLVVTAYGTVSNLTVEDYFTQSWDAISYLADFDGDVSYTKDLTNNPTHKFTWTINSVLKDKETATLTYKAYLDPSAWKPDNTSSSGDPIQKRLIILNQADLRLGDGNGNIGDIINSATAKSEITKQWVYKTGSKDSSGNLNYTLRVNSDPVAKDITSIYDNLSSDSVTAGAAIQYPIKVTVYTSSSSSKKEVKSFELSSGITGFTASSSGWNLDLTTYDGGSLNGKGYYYVITYTVNGGSANNVINGAGINRGNISYGVKTTVEVKSINATKTHTDINYRDGYISWQVTMKTDIDAGTVYYDWLDDDKVGDDNNSSKKDVGFWWFTMEDIEGVEIYQGTELIYSQAQGINKYNISVEAYDYGNPDNPDKRQPVTIPYWTYTISPTTGKYVWSMDSSKAAKVGYYGFKITFSESIKVEKKDDIIVKYNSSTSWENVYHYAMTHERNYGQTAESGAANSYQIDTDNHGKWVLSTGVTKEFGYWAGTPGVRVTVYGLADVLKGSSYDPTTGIITWKIYINHQGDMVGDATVEDLLPAGLEYIDGSATLTVGNDNGSGTSYVDQKFNTNNGNTKYGNIKQVDGKDAITVEPLSTGETKLTVLLENLIGFNNCNDSGWYDDGNVVLTIQTRIVDADMVNDTTGDTRSYTNQVTVTNATMANGSCTTYATQEVTPNTLKETLSKDRGTYNGGTTLTFTLNVNSGEQDLIYTPNSEKNGMGTLEIMDVMSDKMTLATHQSNYFVVVGTKTNKSTGDETTVTLTPATSENIGANEYYVTKVDGEAGKNTYKIIVPDGMKLTITYKVVVDAAVGETPQITNTAYFNYKGLTGSSYSASYDKALAITKAQGSTNASAKEPYFQIYKQDQWGNPIAGVTFALYKVALKDDGTAGEETYVTDATTDESGLVLFDDLNDLENDNAIYCFYETAVPTGYEKSDKPTYFYFVAKTGMNVPGAIGIGYSDKVFEVTNNFKSASLAVPLQKTINNQNQSSSSEFKFTLTSTETPNGAKVYSDEACTSANAVDSFAATIAGSGTTDVETVYFNTVGDYEFTLAENDLSTDQTNEGFAKDDTVYTIKVTVSNDPNTGLYVSSATYQNADGSITGDLLNNGVPAFDNTLTLDAAQVTLEATKKLTGSARESMKEGEFTFKVVEDGVEVATGRVAADTDKDDISKIIFDSIEYGADDLGTHILTIYEVDGGDLSITYSDVIFFAIVKVDTVAGSKQLKAEVTYSTQYDSNLDENGKPVFVNNYTPIVIPSGIRLDIIPYAMIAVVAAGVGGLMIVRRRKRS